MNIKNFYFLVVFFVTITSLNGNQNGCSFNEESVECGSPCAPTCQHPTPTKICMAMCVPCICKSGYIRDEDTNNCVLIAECPNK